MNNIETKTMRYDFSKMSQEAFDKFGITLLAVPVLIYAIDKIYRLADNAMKNDYSFTISYDNFEMKLKKEVAISYQ